VSEWLTHQLFLFASKTNADTCNVQQRVVSWVSDGMPSSSAGTSNAAAGVEIRTPNGPLKCFMYSEGG
jgi:hypothetical protein